MANANWELAHARSHLDAARSTHDEELREEYEQLALDNIVQAVEDVLRRVVALEVRAHASALSAAAPGLRKAEISESVAKTRIALHARLHVVETKV